MKRDEPFNPNSKSENPPIGLYFRLAKLSDRDEISTLMAERNPSKELSEIYKTTDRELNTMESDSKYRLYVADLKGQVVGICRFFDSEGLPEAKKKFPAPEGWYAMGIVVDPKMRRKGIARFLSENRRKFLKDAGVPEIYSIVDERNLTSMRMHSAFGYEEVTRGPGFHNVALESGRGVLFRLSI